MSEFCRGHRTGVCLVLLASFFCLVLAYPLLNQRNPNPCLNFSPAQLQDFYVTGLGFFDISSMSGPNVDAMCRGRVFEPHMVEAFSQYLYAQGGVIEVGAGVGYHTLRMARLAGSFPVYILEGRPEANKGIAQLIRRNNAANVIVVSDAEGLISPGWMPSVLLRESFMKHRIALVKLECRGCELDFLHAIEFVIKKHRPVIIIEIIDDLTRRQAVVGGHQLVLPQGSKDQIIMLLQHWDYQVKSLDDDWDYVAWWTGYK